MSPSNLATITGTDRKAPDLFSKVQSYLSNYYSFSAPEYGLAASLWVATAHSWRIFSVVPYLCITSNTAGSAKTTLLEMLSFICPSGRFANDWTPASIYSAINMGYQTLFFDEAERYYKASIEFSAILNAGYKKGGCVMRRGVELPVYGPKAFALIGDLHYTLRDRCILIHSKKAKPPNKYYYETVQQEGWNLRDELAAVIGTIWHEAVYCAYNAIQLDFLEYREEELWRPLFAMCAVLAPERLRELARVAVALSTRKTAPLRRFSNLQAYEDEARESRYGERLLLDMIKVVGAKTFVSTADLIPALREVPLSPWQDFEGTGLTPDTTGQMRLSRLLAQFGIKAKNHWLPNNKVVRGYGIADLMAAKAKAGL